MQQAAGNPARWCCRPNLTKPFSEISAFLNVGNLSGGFCSGAKKTAPKFKKSMEIRTRGRGTAVAL
jgi:hypothetical protein